MWISCNYYASEIHSDISGASDLTFELDFYIFCQKRAVIFKVVAVISTNTADYYCTCIYIYIRGIHKLLFHIVQQVIYIFFLSFYRRKRNCQVSL